MSDVVFWALILTGLLVTCRSCSKWSDDEKAFHSQICSELKMDIARTSRRVNQVPYVLLLVRAEG